MEMSIPCSVCTEIPSIVTVRTFFIGKPSFDGFGKFSPKTKSAFLFLFGGTANECAMYGGIVP